MYIGLILQVRQPPLSDLKDHFVQKGQSVEDSTLLSDVTGDTFVPELDGEITREELKHCHQQPQREIVW